MLSNTRKGETINELTQCSLYQTWPPDVVDVRADRFPGDFSSPEFVSGASPCGAVKASYLMQQHPRQQIRLRSQAMTIRLFLRSLLYHEVFCSQGLNDSRHFLRLFTLEVNGKNVELLDNIVIGARSRPDADLMLERTVSRTLSVLYLARSEKI